MKNELKRVNMVSCCGAEFEGRFRMIGVAEKCKLSDLKRMQRATTFKNESTPNYEWKTVKNACKVDDNRAELCAKKSVSEEMSVARHFALSFDISYVRITSVARKSYRMFP